jgi:hypothetical protein
MSLKVLLQRIMRRWYCVLAGLLAVAGLCYWVNAHTPVQYRIQGSVVLLPSSETVGGGNPYLFLTGLGQAMDVVTRRITAPAVKDPIAGLYPHTTYTATADQTNGSSILLVSVTSDTQSGAHAVLSTVMAQVPKILVGMQDELSVPQQGRIGSMPVTSQQEPTVDSKSRTQLLVLAAVGGLALILLLTALIDGLILKASSRRSARGVRGRKAPVRRRAGEDATTSNEAGASPPTTEVGVESLSELSR